MSKYTVNFNDWNNDGSFTCLSDSNSFSSLIAQENKHLGMFWVFFLFYHEMYVVCTQ